MRESGEQYAGNRGGEAGRGRKGERKVEDFEKCAMSSSHRQHSGRGVQRLRSELAEHSLFKLHHGPYRIGLAKSKELRNLIVIVNFDLVRFVCLASHVNTTVGRETPK